MRLAGRIALVGLSGLLLVLLAAVISLSVGTLDYSYAQLWAALWHPGSDGTAHLVVWELRLPRIVLGAVVGAALAVAGVAFQTLLRNPLADPYMVGTSAGAALGAALGIVAGLGGTALLGLSPVPFLAFIGALAAMHFVYQLARFGNVLPVETFLLAGVVVSAFLGSLVSLVLSLAHEDMPRIVFWLMGNLSGARWEQVTWALPYLAVGALGLYRLSLSLNVLSLGEESAAQLGVDVERLKGWVVVLGSLLTAAAVSVSGAIGFVGLVVPHITRRLVGPDLRVLMPAAAALGAAFLVVADALARTVLEGREIPVGIVTALLGAPFFLYLLRRRRSEL